MNLLAKFQVTVRRPAVSALSLVREHLFLLVDVWSILFIPAVCKDARNDCDVLAGIYYEFCYSVPISMRTYCPKSCGACIGGEIAKPVINGNLCPFS